MPFILAAAFAFISLLVLSIAVVTTIRAEAREGAGPAASFTYRAYSA